MADNANLTVRRSVLRGTSAGANQGAAIAPDARQGDSGRGGAVFAGAQSVLVMEDVVFSNSSAGFEGGAVFLGQGGTLEVRGGEFEDVAAGGYCFFSFCDSDPDWTDDWGDGCDVGYMGGYNKNTWWCDEFDPVSQQMCCGCGGGQAGERQGLCTDQGRGTISAASGQGGAIFAAKATNVRMCTVSVRHGSSAEGGAIYVQEQAALDLLDTSFTECRAHQSGGALYLKAAKIELVDSRMYNNSAALYGGSLYLTSSELIGIRTTIENCKAQKGGGILARSYSDLGLHEGSLIGSNEAEEFGGGIYMHLSSLAMTQSAMHGNTALMTDGGGIFAERASTIALNGSSVTHNMAGDDGGFYYSEGNHGACTLMVVDSVMHANIAGDKGGGIFTINGGPEGGAITLANVTASNNRAEDSGGAVSVYDNVEVTATGCLFTKNYAYDGGAVFAKKNVGYDDGPGPSFNAEDSVFDGNEAGDGSGQTDSAGGAVYFEESSGSFINCTLSRNSASDGGSLIATYSSTVELRQSSVQHNFAAQYGGGLTIETQSTVSVIACSIHDNTAGKDTALGQGGGFLVVGAVAGSRPTLDIREGTSISNNHAFDGAGIMAQSSYIRIRSSTIRGNRAGSGGDQKGGGIFAIFQSMIELRDQSTVSGNSAGEFGGGVYVEDSTFLMSDSSLVQNDAGAGGGLYAHDASVSLHQEAFVRLNTAEHFGGGMALLQSSLNVVSAVVSGNSARFGSAGGIMAIDSAVTVEGVLELVANSASGDGGAFLLNSTSSLVEGPDHGRRQVIVRQNTAQGDGGGLAVRGGSTVLLSIDLIVAENSARRRGGGIFVGPEVTDEAIELRMLHLTRNTALQGDGGGLFTYSTVTFLADGHTNATGNVAIRGGAMALHDTQMILKPGHMLIAVENEAKESGGALALLAGASLSFEAMPCASECVAGSSFSRLDEKCTPTCMSAECNWDNGACHETMDSAGVDISKPCNRAHCILYDQYPLPDKVDSLTQCDATKCFSAACDWGRDSCEASRSKIRGCPLIDARAFASLKTAHEQSEGNLSFLVGGNSMGGFGRCTTSCQQPAVLDAGNVSTMLVKGTVGGHGADFTGGHQMWLHAALYGTTTTFTIESWVQVHPMNHQLLSSYHHVMT